MIKTDQSNQCDECLGDGYDYESTPCYCGDNYCQHEQSRRTVCIKCGGVGIKPYSVVQKVDDLILIANSIEIIDKYLEFYDEADSKAIQQMVRDDEILIITTPIK